MRKILLFCLLIGLTLSSCAPKKRFIEASDNFSETGEETVIFEQPKILYLLDDKIISESSFLKIDSKQIKSITVIKNQKEIAKYTSEKYDGIIKISLNK